MSESLMHPSVHRGPPATRVRWRLEVALAGVVEQQPQSAVRKLGRTRLRRGTDAGRRTRRVAESMLTQLFVRRPRMRLADSGKEVHGALVRQEIQEPHKLPMQAAGGRRDQGQERLSVLQVVYSRRQVWRELESSRIFIFLLDVIIFD